MTRKKIYGLMDYAEGGGTNTSGRYIALMLVGVMLMVGCRGTKKVAVEPRPEMPAEEIPAPVQPRRTYTVMAFTGEVEGIGVAGQLRIAEDSVMWLSVNKVIEVARALCTPDSLWLRAPLLGRDDALDYATLQRLTSKRVSFDELQQIATADDAEERIRSLAASLGFNAKVTITSRRKVERLTFPFNK